MTLAVLWASTSNALAPAEAARLADELTDALLRAGATAVERATGADEVRDAARRAQAAGEPLLICADDLVAHPGLLWMLATEPAGRSTALVVPDADGDLREDRGRVVPGEGSIRFAGALSLAPADLPLLITSPAARNGRDPLDALLPSLLDAGLVPIATRVRLLHAERVRDDAGLAQAKGAVAAVDEESARLRLAVKERDDFFTTYAISTWSPHVTRLCARLGLTPSGVTAISVVLAVVAALAFWEASRPAMIAGGVLLYLSFVLDCVDGQLARFTRRFGAFGGWLDTMADRAKEYAVYAGLAAGAESLGLRYAWPLAITAIVLQTVRHMTDAWYGALHDEAAARPPAAVQTGVGARLSSASNKVQADTGSLAYWLKRTVVFPIGERWALIAVLAAVFDGRVALAAVVVWGLLAFGYTFALRSLRSISMRVPVMTTVDTMRHRDDGVLVRSLISRAGVPAPLPLALTAAVGGFGALVLSVMATTTTPVVLIAVALIVLCAGLAARARHGGPLDWLVPAALRAAEYLFVVAAGVFGDVPYPVLFLLLFALAMHHYDLVARMEKGSPPSGVDRGRLWSWGWDGRVALLAAGAAAGLATSSMAVLAGIVGGGFLMGSIQDWRASAR